MKKITVCLMLLGFASVCMGNTLIDDDFESYSLDTWPSSWVPDANAVSDPSRNKIALDPTDPTNKVLQMYGVVGSYWGALAYHPVDFPDAFQTSFRVYNGSESLGPGHTNRAAAGLRNGTHWACVTNPYRGLCSFHDDGTLTGYGDALPDGGIVLQSYNTNQWYDVTVDYVRGSYSVSLTYWIDGQNRGQTSIPLSTWDPPAGKPYNHLELQVGAGTVYYDDVRITVPEPATLSLLVLGGLTMLRKRRRR